MKRIVSFEDLEVWKKSIDLAEKIYDLFGKLGDNSFKNQILRAVVSISNNIAEGFERKTNDELKYFLYVSKGSSGEVRSMLHLAYKLNYISKKDMTDLVDSCEEISKMLYGLIHSL